MWKQVPRCSPDVGVSPASRPTFVMINTDVGWVCVAAVSVLPRRKQVANLLPDGEQVRDVLRRREQVWDLLSDGERVRDVLRTGEQVWSCFLRVSRCGMCFVRGGRCGSCFVDVSR